MVNTTCAVSECKSSSRLNKEVRFHQFPHDEERCKLWLEACKRPDLAGRSSKSLRNVHICNSHFERRMYGKNSLKKTAIPTLLLPSKEYLSTLTQTDAKVKNLTGALFNTSPNVPWAGPSLVISSDGPSTQSTEDNTCTGAAETNAEISNIHDDDPAGSKCDSCGYRFSQFVFACAQCDERACGACDAREARGRHATHFVLRAPAAGPEEQLNSVLKLIQSAMQEPSPEPIMLKTEIKEEFEDPLSAAKCEEPQAGHSMDTAELQMVPEQSPGPMVHFISSQANTFGIVPTGNIPTGIVPTGNVPTGSGPTWKVATGNVPTRNVPSENVATGTVLPVKQEFNITSQDKTETDTSSFSIHESPTSVPTGNVPIKQEELIVPLDIVETENDISTAPSHTKPLQLTNLTVRATAPEELNETSRSTNSEPSLGPQIHLLHPIGSAFNREGIFITPDHVKTEITPVRVATEREISSEETEMDESDPKPEIPTANPPTKLTKTIHVNKNRKPRARIRRNNNIDIPSERNDTSEYKRKWPMLRKDRTKIPKGPTGFREMLTAVETERERISLTDSV